MKKRILLVDDDQDFCLLLSRYLDHNNYETHIAANGNAAIRKMINSDFDAVLCDFRLGDMNGKDFLLKLNDLDLRPIVIFVTGYATNKIFSEMLELGAQDYLSKPVIPSEILTALNEAFENSASSANSGFNISNTKQREDKMLFTGNGFVL